MSKRIERVNALIKRELSRMILREVDFPVGVLVTLTRVETTNDLRESNVYISALPEEKTSQALVILNRFIYELQGKINKKLNMRPLPRLKFLTERDIKKAARIEELLEELKKDQK